MKNYSFEALIPAGLPSKTSMTPDYNCLPQWNSSFLCHFLPSCHHIVAMSLSPAPPVFIYFFVQDRQILSGDAHLKHVHFPTRVETELGSVLVLEW